MSREPLLLRPAVVLLVTLLAACATARKAAVEEPAPAPTEAPVVAVVPAPEAPPPAPPPEEPEPQAVPDEAAMRAAVAAERERLAALRIVASPAVAAVGRPVTIEVPGDDAATAEYDFGDGFSRSPRAVFDTFGVKTVRVRLGEGVTETIREIEIVVRGRATITLARDMIEHDELGGALIEATVSGDGSYDHLVGFSEGTEVFRAERAETYGLPVVFAGRRTFQGALSMKGHRVADLNDVTLTGTNTPPPPPSYQGTDFIRVRVGATVEFTVRSVDPNNNPVVYEVRFAPPGARFDETTGVFVWTPTAADRGTYLMHFKAYDLPFRTSRSFSQRGIIVER